MKDLKSAIEDQIIAAKADISRKVREVRLLELARRDLSTGVHETVVIATLRVHGVEVDRAW